MSISYELHTDTGLHPLVFIDKILQGRELRVPLKNSRIDKETGLIIDVEKMELIDIEYDDYSTFYTFDNYGFISNTWVEFYIHKPKLVARIGLLHRLLFSLINTTTSNMILYYIDLTTVVFLKVNQRLLINKSYKDRIDNDLLEKINIPYDFFEGESPQGTEVSTLKQV